MKYSDVYKSHTGKVSDKWESYLGFYDRLTSSISPRSILEIGVQNGGSLEVWGKKFPEAELIIGMDIDEKCSELQFEDKRIQVIVGDAGNPRTQEALKRTANSFDLVIDDGSHVSNDVIKALIAYLPLVNFGGAFVIEDLHAAYWPSWGGGLTQGDSAVNFLKRIIDVINVEHWDRSVSIRDYLSGFAPLTSEFIESLNHVRTISFEDSMCTILLVEDGSVSRLGLRTSAGQTADVISSTLTTAGKNSIAEKNLGQELPAGFFAPDFYEKELAELEMLRQRSIAREQELETLNAKLISTSNENTELKNLNVNLLSSYEEITSSKLWKLTSFLRKSSRV